MTFQGTENDILSQKSNHSVQTVLQNEHLAKRSKRHRFFASSNIFKRLLASKVPWQPRQHLGYSVLLRNSTPSLEKQSHFATEK